MEINFKTRIAIKSQALVDFLAEWQENQVPAPHNVPEHWVMYFDGSLKLDGGGAGVLFISPKGEQLNWRATDMEAPVTVREVLMIEEDWRI